MRKMLHEHKGRRWFGLIRGSECRGMGWRVGKDGLSKFHKGLGRWSEWGFKKWAEFFRWTRGDKALEVPGTTRAKEQKWENSTCSGAAGDRAFSLEGCGDGEIGGGGVGRRLDQSLWTPFEMNIKHFTVTKCFVWGSSHSSFSLGILLQIYS